MDHTDRFKRFRAGWVDPGTIEVTRQYEKADRAALLALFREKRAWRITFDDGSKVEIDGSYINKIGQPTEREGVVMEDFAIKVSGPPTFTAAA